MRLYTWRLQLNLTRGDRTNQTRYRPSPLKSVATGAQVQQVESDAIIKRRLTLVEEKLNRIERSSPTVE